MAGTYQAMDDSEEIEEDPQGSDPDHDMGMNYNEDHQELEVDEAQMTSGENWTGTKIEMTDLLAAITAVPDDATRMLQEDTGWTTLP